MRNLCFGDRHERLLTSFAGEEKPGWPHAFTADPEFLLAEFHEVDELGNGVHLQETMVTPSS